MTRKEQDYNSAGKHVQKKGGRDGRVGGGGGGEWKRFTRVQSTSSHTAF